MVLTGHLILHAVRLLTSQKFLKAQRDVPIPVVVVLLKHIGHPLQYDTTLHEQIEAHTILSTFIVGRVQ